MFTAFELAGVGVHTAAPCTVEVAPATTGSGVSFVTADGDVPARAAHIDPESTRATDLVAGAGRVRTVEHLLAALAWFGLPDCTIAVSGPELPILDGSAAPWCTALLAAGARPGPRFFEPPRQLTVTIGDSAATLTPRSPGHQPVYRVELIFDPAEARSQSFELRPLADDGLTEVAPARTFALAAEVPALLDAGLGRGGTLDNALVIGPGGPINPGGERLPDEPARHKLLDALGDLALLGAWPRADLTLIRPGHRLLHALVRRIAAEREAPR